MTLPADTIDASIGRRVWMTGIGALAGLSVFAVWLRVDQYGPSPDRIAAGCASLIALGYGALCALAVPRRQGWMARLRQANRVMALVVIGVAALWLTPLLNAERLSARDQVARIASGTVAVADADLWFLGRELGVAGTRALADLAKIDLPDGDRLAARIAALDAAASRYHFEQEGARERAAGDLAELIRIVPARPDDAAGLTKADFAGVDPPQLARWLRACRRQEAVAGCVLMQADLLPDTPGDEALFLWDSPGGLRMMGLHAGTARPPLLLGGAGSGLPADAVDLVLRGEVSVGIPALRSVSLGDAEIVLLP